MSNKCNTKSIPEISLLVSADSVDRFSTLLQSGIFLSVRQGESIGGLLASIPGFSKEYIQNRVQTIFVDGLPADDLEQQFSEEETVLAISAAMPGLAGAIFRKNGPHASLRTATAKKSNQLLSDKTVSVRLKLFNIIAKERGAALLAGGCLLQAASLRKFLNYRPPLAASIRKITINQQEADIKVLQQNLATDYIISLSITCPHAH